MYFYTFLITRTRKSDIRNVAIIVYCYNSMPIIMLSMYNLIINPVAIINMSIIDIFFQLIE